jgi:hypothetical protein
MRNTLSLSLLVVLVPFHLGAQVARPAGDPSIQVDLSKEAQSITPETYGTSSLTYVSLSAWDFHPQDSSVTYGVIGAGMYQTGGTGVFEAPVRLPEGALVSYLELYACDTTPSNNIASFFRGARMTDGMWTFVTGPIATPSLAGCGPVSLTISPVLINNAANSYTVELSLDGSNTGLSFRSFRVGYKLQVSPGPATATFTDVPTTHPFYKFVEALYAAGITAGCGNGNFCPDANVTRGQMAVFLSAALGLHFAP